MKKKLNILCFIVMLVLSYSVLEAVYYMGIGFKSGVELGMSTKMNVQRRQELMHLENINLLPRNLSRNFLTDSVYNAKTGKYIPASFGQMTVSVDTQPSIVLKVFSVSATLTDFVTTVWAIILFIRIVVSINKSEIFNWKNVRRIRRLGVLLIVSFACTFLTAFLTVYNVEKVFSSMHYTLCLTDMVKITSLVLGLTALIVAEVFAIGLKMKEEQELTI
ncbi:DUF2975 domain-containing protein [Bacteroidaceae bacterium HV4-6-C5C]|jgi:hypothetical protein|nr:DUF2975 domain-containing protein [Bacteroidaceae bacterium HV4-6-C5C]